MIRPYRFVLGVALLASAACGGPRLPVAATSATRGESDLDALITAYQGTHPVGGFAVGVQHGGDTVFSKGYGFADVDAQQTATDQTVFAIGSMTKQFTAAAVLQLADAGKLNLDADISTVVTEFPAHAQPITLRHLLSHTSGIPDYFPDGDDPITYKPITPADMVKRFATAPLDFAPGSNFAYSNSNFYLLGLAIERTSGQSYLDYLKTHLFAPLGLAHTDECATHDSNPQMAQGYTGDATKVTKAPDLDMSWAYAAGFLCSTVGDILAWNHALHGGAVLPDWAYQLMTTPYVMADGTPTTYGTGLFVDAVQGHRHFEHGGDTFTFASQEAFYPADDLSIVILTNTEGVFDRFALERSIGRAVLGLPTPQPAATPLPADLGTQLVGKYDVLGRTIFGPNPVTIAVDATSGKGSLTVASQALPLSYLGNDQLAVQLPTASDLQVSLAFPAGAGPKPFFSVYLDEMMFARGMRHAP